MTLGKHPDIEVVPMHHEQSASMAARAITGKRGKSLFVSNDWAGWCQCYYRVRRRMGRPEAIIFISGQVETISLISGNNAKQACKSSILSEWLKATKEAIRLTDPHMISYELARLADVATSGRPGPVWLDIPLDLQNFAITNRHVPSI